MIFATDYFQLVKIVSEPKNDMFLEYFQSHSTLTIYLQYIKILKESFNYLEFIHVLRTQNTTADKLAQSAQIQLYFVVHIDTELPV